MTIRQRIQDFLGTQDLSVLIRRTGIELADLRTAVAKLEEANRVLLSGLGRVIAKIDPYYGMSEFDPERKAESNKIGDMVIKRLRGEEEMNKRSRL